MREGGGILWRGGWDSVRRGGEGKRDEGEG